MFLVDNINYIVSASSPLIVETDMFYQAGNVNYLKANYSLCRFDLPEGHEVGWCTYNGGAFTTIEKSPPKPEPPKTADEETLQAISTKKDEINAMCEQTIVYGVDYGGGHYTLTKYDQINIKTWGDLAAQGKTVPYHADGEDCRMYPPAEFLGLVSAVTLHILYNQTYANQLKLQVAEMVELADVLAVYYGTPLSEERQAKLNDILQKTATELGLTYETTD